MISRRDAFKLGAAGLIAPAIPTTSNASALVASPEQAGSVPMFRGNAARTGEMPDLGPSLDKPIVVKWKWDSGLPSGSVVEAQPWAVTNEIVICAVSYYNDHALAILDASTGNLIWSTELGSISYFWGVEDNVILASELATNNQNNLVAFDAKSGNRIWTYSFTSYSPSVEIKDGSVWVSTSESQVLIDLKSGQTQWEDVTFLVTEGGIVLVGTKEKFVALEEHSSAQLWEVPMWVGRPIVADGIIYAHGAGATVSSLDLSTGEILWQFNNENGGTGLRYSDGRVFVISRSQTIHALDASSGTEQWRYKIELDDEEIYVDIQAIDAILDGVLYVTISLGDHYNFIGGLYIAIDAASGLERWRYAIQSEWEWGAINSISEISGGLVFGSTYFGGDGGRGEEQFLAIDAENGSLRWSLVGMASLGLRTADSMLFIQDLTDIIAVDPYSGDERWSLSSENEIETIDETNGLIFVSSYFDDTSEYSISALDVNTGERRWSRMSNGDFRSWKISNGVGYHFSWPSNHFFHAIDMENGNEHWNFGAYHGSHAEIAGDSIYLNILGVLYALGNTEMGLVDVLLASDTIIRAAPSSTAVERGSSSAGSVVENIGAQEVHDGQTWVEITIDDVTGWIPLEAIDPATLPPEGEIEYVYIPE